MRTAAAGLLLALGACSVVGPEFEAPAPVLPPAYDAFVPAIFEGPRLPERWWTAFGDPLLDELVERGIAANPDLRVAVARVREARALARAVVGETGPQIDLSGEAGGTYRNGTGSDSGDDSRSELSAGGGLGGVWEIDLFGGLFRTRQAAWAEAERQEALAREALRLTVAEVARSYVALRAAQRRLALSEDLLEVQRRTLGLVRERVKAGLAPALDLTRAEGQLATQIADLGPLRAEIDLRRNALAVLLGEFPGALDGLLAGAADIPDLAVGNALGVPTDLLRRRPDLQAAELAIAVATAEVGVETADLYPRLTLPGSITLDIADIAAGATAQVVASISALIELPLFDGGQREAEVTAAEERVVQATWLYRQTLLAALNEVESALLTYQAGRARIGALEEAVASNRDAFAQSQVLYQRGFASFIDVLDGQRTLNSSLQELTLARRDAALAIIDLYAALGTTLQPPDL